MESSFINNDNGSSLNQTLPPFLDIKDEINSIKERKNAAIKVAKMIGAKKPFFLNFKDNQLDNYPLLKVIKPLEKLIKKTKPNIIYTHYQDDLNMLESNSYKPCNHNSDRWGHLNFCLAHF